MTDRIPDTPCSEPPCEWQEGTTFPCLLHMREHQGKRVTCGLCGGTGTDGIMSLPQCIPPKCPACDGSGRTPLPTPTNLF